MSRFYISQPVRVNCPMSRQHGAETFVIALDFRTPTDSFGNFYTGTQVNLRLPDYIVAMSGVSHAVFEDHELEPIILPGCEEEETQSQPEKEKVHA